MVRPGWEFFGRAGQPCPGFGRFCRTMLAPDGVNRDYISHAKKACFVTTPCKSHRATPCLGARSKPMLDGCGAMIAVAGLLTCPRPMAAKATNHYA